MRGETTGATLIVNPRAGRGGGEDAGEAVCDRLRTRWPGLRAIVTSSREHAEQVAREAASAGIGTLFVLGGDGTLNDVVNGVAAIEGALARTVFGVLPGGTGNDLAGTLGLRTSLEEAAELLCSAEARSIDLAMLDDRIFTNVSAGGLFAEASEAVTPAAKSLAGRLAYVVAGSRALLDHEDVTLELAAKTPEGPLTWEGNVTMFAVCNGGTAGGGQPLAPYARIDDGWLDAFVVAHAGPIGLAKVLLAIPGGHHLEDDRVVGFRASELELRFARPTSVNVDGEVTTRSRARYRVLPSATRVLSATRVPSAARVPGPRAR